MALALSDFASALSLATYTVTNFLSLDSSIKNLIHAALLRVTCIHADAVDADGWRA